MARKKHSPIFAAAALVPVLFLASCSGGGGDSLSGAIPTVHTVGWEYNGSSADGGVGVATHWTSKGDTRRLGGGRYHSEAEGLFVADNGDVYVAGFETNSYGNQQPKVWKNGSPLYSPNLAPGMNHGRALGVFARGNDVYVAGWEANNLSESAVLWKNNVRQTLRRGDGGSAGEDYWASAYRVAVSNSGDAYVCGGESWYEYDYSRGDYLNTGRAVVWVNGVPKAIHEDSIYDGDYYNGALMPEAYALDIAIDGNSVYAVGAVMGYGTSAFGGSISTARLWELSAGPNGSLRSQKDIGAGTGNSESWSVYASGGNVYAALMEYTSYSSSRVPVAKYYKNGSLHTLPGGDRTVANGISGHGGNVYVVGYEMGAGWFVAKYWINGEPHTISGGDHPAGAFCIVVK